MANATQAVQSLLRSTDKIAWILDTGANTPNNGTNTATQGSNMRSRRIFIILTHDEGDKESGGLFVFKWGRTNPPSITIVTSLALLPDLEFEAVELTASGTQKGLASGNAGPDILVNIRSDGKEFSFVTHDSTAVGELAAECKRLKKIEVVEDEASQRTHGWMSAYSPDTGNQRYISHLLKPQDLRLVHRGPALSSASAGIRGDEDADLVRIRDDWIKQKVASRRKEYSSQHPIRIRVGTFNVNGKSPSKSIESWVKGIQSIGQSRIDRGPDMYIFGFQELDQSAAALLYSTSNVLEMEWTEAILKSLGKEATFYTKFASRQLVGMLIIGFVRKSLRPYVSDISENNVGVGIMGLMGNKGAVGIRFKLYNTTICCVASHLAAGEGMADRRNYDYMEITQRLTFPVHAPTPAEAAEQIQPISATIFEADALIWLGDLNYRVDLPTAEVEEMMQPPVKPYNLKTMLDFDELCMSRSKAECFELFTENPITFPPTYRYYVDTEKLDEKRKPGWTDRILSLSSPLCSLQQISYQSHPDISLSDHKPISADITLEASRIDREVYSQTVLSVLKTVKGHTATTSATPKVQISEKFIELGDVRYLDPIKKEFQIENVGPYACAFRFISPDEHGSLTPEWMSLNVQHGFLLPKESITVSLAVSISDSVAAQLNEGIMKLEATLIVHVEHGLDHFMAISGNYLPTCFARRVEALIRLPSSARQSHSLEPLSESRAANIPKELMRIIDWLMTHPLQERAEELFSSISSDDLLSSIRESLDTGDAFPFEEDESKWSPTEVTLAFGETLVHFLRVTVDPIVPLESYPIIAGILEGEEQTGFLDSLPHTSVNIWVTVLAFLQFACLQSGDNASQAEVADKIAAIFAPILLPAKTGPSPEISLTPLQKRKFMLLFLSS